MSHPLIEVSALTWWYPGAHQLIFDDFHFTLQQGDFCFLVGKSGTGKTTLVKFLLRQLVPPLKTIFYNKEDIARFGADEVQTYRRNLGVVFQDFKLIETMTVRENVIYPLLIDGTDPLEKIQYLDSIMKMLGLFEKKQVPCKLLSWWEKQRVSIARALASDPKFIIADEPTGNLDRENSQAIADALIDLHKQGHTILLITHDQRLVDYIADHHHDTKRVVLSV